MLHSKPVLIVTGTNGKGSTLAFCEAILLAAGYKVGAFYSPHVFDSSERFKINGKPIFNIPCDDFHTMTQSAISLFNQPELDALLFEVGIGGRLDPVNTLIDPDVSVITNIDLDHQDRLGNTLEEIGFEKAHVFRSGKPSIFGGDKIPYSVLRYAEKINTTLFSYGKNFTYSVRDNHWEFSNNKASYKNLPLPKLLLHNAAIALEALSHFPLVISEEAIHEGLKKANLPGRFKIIDKPVRQIFDVAHNPASAKLLSENLTRISTTGKTIGVVGMLKDKDITGTLYEMKSIIDKWVIGRLQDPRTAFREDFEKALADFEWFEDIQEAYRYALAQAGPDDRLIVFGSFRTVGALCPDKN